MSLVRLPWIVAVCVAIAVSAVSAALAAGGDLDPSFGAGGVVRHRSGVFQAMAVARDGKLVLVGAEDLGHGSLGFAVRRYRADGSIDRSFSGDGKVTTRLSATSCDPGPSDVLLQRDGKIVAVGGAGCRVGRVAVARYLPDGRLDRTFSRDGRMTMRFGAGCRFSHARGAALDGDGRIVIAGQAGCTRADGFTVTFALTRLRPDGRVDRTFGDDGRVLTDLTPGFDNAHDVAIQRDGRIVAAGTADEDGLTDGDARWRIAVARYRRNGTLDRSFGRGGTVTTDLAGVGTCGPAEGRALGLQADGRIVVAGEARCGHSRFALVRYDAHGGLDPSFGANGKVATAFDPSGGCLSPAVNDLAIQPDDRIIAAGTAGCKDPHPSFALARYRANGELDRSFGRGGKRLTTLSKRGGEDACPESIGALGVQGERIIAAGRSCSSFVLLGYRSR